MAILEAILGAVSAAGKIAKSVDQLGRELDGDRSVVLIVENKTHHPLERIGYHHDHGGFVVTPDIAIPAMSVGIFSSKDTGFETGTEGGVNYRLHDHEAEDTVFEISWANPFIGSNKANAYAWANGGHNPHTASSIFKGEAVPGGGDKKVEMRYTLLAR